MPHPSPITPPPEIPGFTTTDIWFHDGNIIILVESTAFKVHRHQLQRHSEVFAGLFSVPPPDEQFLLDGCPVVELFDTALDVYHWLKALYDGLYFSPERPEDFSPIASVLHLSHKYITSEALRNHCLLRLRQDWPRTLLGWDIRESTANCNGQYDPRRYYVHPIHTVLFGLEHDILEILPAAFYDLSRYGPSKIVEGTESIPQPHPFSQPPKFLTLPHDVIANVLKGREASQLHLAIFITNKVANYTPVLRCRDKGSVKICKEGIEKLALNLMRSVNGVAFGRDADPLYTLMEIMNCLKDESYRTEELRLCDHCSHDFLRLVHKEREVVWKLIPIWFGLATKCDTVNTNMF